MTASQVKHIKPKKLVVGVIHEFNGSHKAVAVAGCA